MHNTTSTILGFLAFCLLLALAWSVVFGLVYLLRN